MKRYPDFEKLKTQEQNIRARPHHDFEIQIVLARMLEILLETPRWKVWAWYPIARQVDIIVRIHKKCCDITYD